MPPPGPGVELRGIHRKNSGSRFFVGQGRRIPGERGYGVRESLPGNPKRRFWSPVSCCLIASSLPRACSLTESGRPGLRIAWSSQKYAQSVSTGRPSPSMCITPSWYWAWGSPAWAASRKKCAAMVASRGKPCPVRCRYPSAKRSPGVAAHAGRQGRERAAKAQQETTQRPSRQRRGLEKSSGGAVAGRTQEMNDVGKCMREPQCGARSRSRSSRGLGERYRPSGPLSLEGEKGETGSLRGTTGAGSSQASMRMG